MTTASEILLRAATRIEKPDAWTQEALARNRFRTPTEPTDREATCWCMLGAIRVEARAVESWPDDLEAKARSCVRNLEPAHEGIGAFNDNPSTTQADAVALLRQAAKECDK